MFPRKFLNANYQQCMPYGCTIYVITTWVLVRHVHENKSPSISLYLVNREINLPRIKFGFQYIVLIQRLILSFTSAICILASPKISIVPRIMSRETLFQMVFFSDLHMQEETQQAIVLVFVVSGCIIFTFLLSIFVLQESSILRNSKLCEEK